MTNIHSSNQQGRYMWPFLIPNRYKYIVAFVQVWIYSNINTTKEVSMKPLTEKQQEVFDYIVKCQSEGFTPSRKEIAEHVGVGSHNAAQLRLDAIARKGWIEIESGKSRRIKVLERNNKDNQK